MNRPVVAVVWSWGLLLGMIIPSAGARPTALSEETYAAIQDAFLREEFERVVTLVQPLVESSRLDLLSDTVTKEQASRAIRVRLWYALSLERLQRSGDALREIDQLKTSLFGMRSPEMKSLWPEVLFWEGEIGRKALQMVRARVAYQRLLSNFPDSLWRPHAQLGLGLVLFHQQAYEEASLQFHNVVLTAPSSPAAREALVLEGVCDIRLQRLPSAVARFRHLLEQSAEPGLRGQAAFYLGEALTGLHRFEEAASAYQQAIEANPDSLWAHVAHFGLGWSYFQQHRCHESLQAFAAYLQTDPGSSRAEVSALRDAAQVGLLFAQGRCLMELGHDEQALERFEELRGHTQDHPLTTDAGLSQAELLEKQHRFSEALAILEPLLRLSLQEPQRKQAHLRLGSVYLAQGEALKATAQFHLAKETEEVELRQAALNGLGDAQMLLGNTEEALRWYEGAVRVSPLSPASGYATYQIGRAKLAMGQINEAIDLFQRLTRRPHPGLATDASLALAFAYLSNAQPELARKELEHLRAQDPTGPQAARASYYLALVALNEERLAEAKRLCQDVIQQAPLSDEALDARLVLADLVATESSPKEAMSALQKAFDELAHPSPRHRGQLAKKLGDLARKTFAYAQAIHWYEVAWQHLPADRGELEYWIASCYEEAGDLAVAIHRYRSIEHAVWRIRGQLAAAKLLEREGQWQEAMTLYGAITHQPVPEAKIAQERLATLRNESLVRNP